MDQNEKSQINKGASLVSREWIFGIRTEVSDPVQYISKDCLIYPAGSALVTYSKDGQIFHPFNRSCKPESISLSKNR